MTKLNPCPDCGVEPAFQEGDSGFAIGCESCDSVVIVASKSANGAINAWNAASGEKPEKTLRDEFAMAALVGTLAANLGAPSTYTVFAEDAYKHADAMIKERNK